MSNWRSICKLLRGLSGAEDFDKFLSNLSKHNLLSGNDDFDELLSNFACRKWRPNVDDFWMPFMQIKSPEMALTCWRIWWFWRFLRKSLHKYYARKTWDGISFVLLFFYILCSKVRLPNQNAYGNGDENINIYFLRTKRVEQTGIYTFSTFSFVLWACCLIEENQNEISFILQCILHFLC